MVNLEHMKNKKDKVFLDHPPLRPWIRLVMGRLQVSRCIAVLKGHILKNTHFFHETVPGLQTQNPHIVCSIK